MLSTALKVAIKCYVNELSCQLESAIIECSDNRVYATPFWFRVLSNLASVVILLVAWDSVANLGARTMLCLNLRAPQVKLLPKDLEEQICEVSLLLALQNEV